MSFFQTKKLNIETLGEYLRDTRIVLKLTIPQVSRLTQIPEKFLRCLEEGNYENLPADVYVKGFLKTLSAVYKVSPQILVDQFEQERGVAQSLKNDPLLPKHKKTLGIPRFVITPKTFTIVAVVTFALLSTGYLIWQVRSVSAPPELLLEFPDRDLSIDSRSLLLRGFTEQGSRVYVNGQEVLVEETGAFQEIMNLTSGTNNILVRAQNKFGKTSQIERVVIVSSFSEAAASSDDFEQKIFLEVFIGPENAWISAISDGLEVYNAIVVAGEKLELFAEKELLLSTGNAGSTRVVYNRRDLGLLGRAGEVISNIRFTQ